MMKQHNSIIHFMSKNIWLLLKYSYYFKVVNEKTTSYILEATFER